MGEATTLQQPTELEDSAPGGISDGIPDECIRPLFIKRTPKRDRPTLECEQAVEAVLAMSDSQTEAA